MDKFQIKIGELVVSRKPVYLDLRKLVETRALIEASSGGGKSTLMRLIAERAAGVMQTIILDHEDEFVTLRKVLDVLLVGDRRDVPISVESAALLARRLADMRISAVVNLYDLELEGRRAFVAEFLNALLNVPKSMWHPMLLMLDEAHIYAPEKGNVPSRAAVVNMMSQGRKREFCEIVATQRFSKIDKDGIADAKNVFIGGTVLDVDQKRAGDILGLKTADYPLLRDMASGEWYAFGPALVSSQRGVIHFVADKPQTEKPKSGTQDFVVPKASDVIESLVAQLGDIPAQAREESDTLERLQTENARLRRELTARPVQERVVLQEPRVEIQVVEKPVLNGQLPRLEAALDRMTSDFVIPLTQGISGLIEPIATELRSIHDAIERVQNAPTPVIPSRSMDFTKYADMTPRQIERDSDFKAVAKALRTTNPFSNATTEPITDYMRDLLKTFAKRHPLPLTKSQLALLAGKGKKSSALDSALAKIKRLGLVTSGNEMNLTESGFSALGADVPLPPQTFSDIVTLWREVLSEYERALFDVMLAAPHGLTLDELSARSGKSKTSSQFQSTVAMFVKNKIATRRGERIALHNPLSR